MNAYRISIRRAGCKDHEYTGIYRDSCAAFEDALAIVGHEARIVVRPALSEPGQAGRPRVLVKLEAQPCR